ncbi:MAG: tRNA (guanosine(37)-N1)-methyltransferase TrmD [Clostridia bacterium]|nr:tRNA (guanosine(37)-N1)-methyltransferase TrmD [Clostridia bacterium]
MKIDILTLFPEMFSALDSSIIGRAVKNGDLEINIINIRDFAHDKHKRCDDTPYGGGAGMVMMVEPIFKAVNSVKTANSHVIYTSPRGRTLNQAIVQELAEKEHIVILCGHYEGVDERAIELCVDEEISVGDYVLTGGEIPAMIIADAVSRYVDGVVKKTSLEEESFSNGLLEYPQYTKPQVFEGLEVPAVLLSGNHQEVDKWRLEQAEKITKERRPDLLKRREEQ